MPNAKNQRKWLKINKHVRDNRLYKLAVGNIHKELLWKQMFIPIRRYQQL